MAHLWLKIISVMIFSATLYSIVTLSILEINPLVLIICNTLAVAIWTAKEVVIIDFDKRVIGEGFRILGMTYLDKLNFSGIEKIFINRISAKATLVHVTGSRDYHTVFYKAFLKTNEGDKVVVGVSADKEKLIRRLLEYNRVINTTIFDTTSAEPVIVSG